MIKIIEPKECSAAYAPLLYRVEGLDPEKVTDLMVIAENREGLGVDMIVGIKRVAHRESFEINVANYYQSRLNPEPLFENESGFYKTSGRDVKTGINVENSRSKDVIALAASESTELAKQLSNAPRRVRIAENEFDEIAFYAPERELTPILTLIADSVERKIVLPTQRFEKGVYLFILNVGEIMERAGIVQGGRWMKIDLKLQEQGEVVMEREYDIVEKQNSATRICWLNPLGGVDYYTFRGAQEQSVVIKKRRTYSEQGHRVSSSKAEYRRMVNSECEPEKTIGWLAEIACSPRVWLVEESTVGAGDSEEGLRIGFKEVDVITSTLIIKSEHPQALSLLLRERTDRSFQRN